MTHVRGAVRKPSSSASIVLPTLLNVMLRACSTGGGW
jgi:hypothetical protein